MLGKVTHSHENNVKKKSWSSWLIQRQLGDVCLSLFCPVHPNSSVGRLCWPVRVFTRTVSFFLLRFLHNWDLCFESLSCCSMNPWPPRCIPEGTAECCGSHFGSGCQRPSMQQNSLKPSRLMSDRGAFLSPTWWQSKILRDESEILNSGYSISPSPAFTWKQVTWMSRKTFSNSFRS